MSSDHLRPIMFRAPEDVFLRLQALADAEERSVAFVTRRIVEKALGRRSVRRKTNAAVAVRVDVRGSARHGEE